MPSSLPLNLIFIFLPMISIEGAWDTVSDFFNDIITLVLEVLWENVLLEVVWNKLAVFLFVTLTYTWGFMLILMLITYGIYQKYVWR